jgi:hypothetical protein
MTEVDGAWSGMSTYMLKSDSLTTTGQKYVRIDTRVRMILFERDITLLSGDALIMQGGYSLSAGRIVITPVRAADIGNPALWLGGEFEYSVRSELDGIRSMVLDRTDLDTNNLTGTVDTTFRVVRLYPESDDHGIGVF